MKLRLFFTLMCTVSLNVSHAAPTESRSWTSKNGKKITGKATAMTSKGAVQIVTKDGRKVAIQIDGFSKGDQALLEKHFGGDAQPQPVPTGTHRGPVHADADTSYYLYLPEDHDPKVPTPVMIWTQSDGAKNDTLLRFTEAADLLGMIIATPVEARSEGSVTLVNNLAHTRDVLASLGRDFSLSCHSLHFGGEKSGATAAFHNSLTIKNAGTFTVSGAFNPDMTGANEGHHFMASSTNSSYRYLTAWAAAKFGKDGTHYLYSGTREMPDSRDIAIGMTWMYAQGLYANYACRKDEAADFEKRMLPWLKEVALTSRGDAAYLTTMLTDLCKLRGRFKKDAERLHAALMSDSKTTAHVAGIAALDDFSERRLVKYGSHFTPLFGHDPIKFDRICADLAETYHEATELQPIFKMLAEPTHQ